jgi:hypothetical protein
MAKDSRYDAELEYLSDYTADVLRELSWMITMDGACRTFEPRMEVGGRAEARDQPRLWGQSP